MGREGTRLGWMWIWMGKIVCHSALDGDCEMKIRSHLDTIVPLPPAQQLRRLYPLVRFLWTFVQRTAILPWFVLRCVWVTGRDRFGSLDSVPEYGGDSPPSGRGGAVSNGIASDFPRTASGVSATTGVPSPHKPPLTPSRSVPTISRPSGGEVFAGVSADCVKVDGVDVVDLSVRAPAVEPMIPTPKVYEPVHRPSG
jgi:hypothetical protein